MAIKKFYSNKAKTGWKPNPDFRAGTTKNPQKENERKYFSWGYDIDLDPVEYKPDGTPKRNRERVHGFATRQLADKAAGKVKHSEIEEKYNLKKVIFPTVQQVLQKYLDNLLSKKEKRRALTIFERWLDLIPVIRVNDLDTTHLNVYVEARREVVKDVSINREINNIASALHNAYKDFPVLEKWVCPRIPRLKTSRARRERLITKFEIERLFKNLYKPVTEKETVRDYHKRIIVGQVFQMTILTGARVGEVAAMRWEHIDWQAKILQIVGQKSRYVASQNVRYLELTPTMENILRFRLKYNVFDFKEFVFCRTGNSVTHYHSILGDAAAEAKIPYGKLTEGGFVTHDARHTAVTRMMQAGIDLSTIGSITGHADKTLILHYSHATRQSRQIAGKVLDDFGDIENNLLN